MARGWPDFVYPVGIFAQYVDYVTVDIGKVEAGVTFNVNIVDSSITMDVNITNASINTNATIVDATIALDVNATIVGATATLDVKLVDSAITLDVNITNASINTNAVITDCQVTLDVNITNPVINVEIQGTPTINVQTEEGANIIIDKLTTTAFYEIRQVYSNAATSYTGWQKLDKPYGKLFSRQCRGYLVEVGIYLRNPQASDDTLIVELRPYPGLAPVKTISKTIAAGTTEGTIWVGVLDYWLYDSLFIVVKSENGYIEVAYDDSTDTPPDSWYWDSTDEVWQPISATIMHLWIEAKIHGQTVGTVPVDGVVGTYEFPYNTSRAEVSLQPFPAGTNTLLEIDNPGHNLLTLFTSSSPDVVLYVECDGEAIFAAPLSLLYNSFLDQGVDAGIVITKWDTTNNRYAIAIKFKYSWRKKLHIWIDNVTGADQECGLYIAYKLTT
ncbi:MAG: hypothetical protein DRQ46_10390 [Gammaproteobacteria bacterium]|nr:MAG: hypothetical protein DRQ46_10390 [Gammaproteobacteria bacterium]